MRARRLSIVKAITEILWERILSENQDPPKLRHSWVGEIGRVVWEFPLRENIKKSNVKGRIRQCVQGKHMLHTYQRYVRKYVNESSNCSLLVYFEEPNFRF